LSAPPSSIIIRQKCGCFGSDCQPKAAQRLPIVLLRAVDSLYGRFFALVKKMNYHRGLSIEAPAGNFEDDAVDSLRFFREMLA
jgi:hypothetical protein